MPSSSERQEAILDILENQEHISVKELVSKLYFSESSIRRDLKRMEKLGLVVLHWGEVTLNRGLHFELPVITRSVANKLQKQKIAECAASFIQNGDSIYLDASSTALGMLPYLSDRLDLTIVTNGICTIQQAYRCTNGTFICLGGILRQRNGSSLTGGFTYANIQATHCDKMFFSARAVDADFGASDLSEDETEVKKYMFKNSDNVILLADSSKFNIRSIFQICSLDCVDKIITDSGADYSSASWSAYSNKIITI